MKGGERVGGEEVLAARRAAGLTQEQAAPIVHVTADGWQNWEQERTGMPLATFELFLLKTGQYTVKSATRGTETEPGLLRLRLRTGRVIELSMRHNVVQQIAAMERAG